MDAGNYKTDGFCNYVVSYSLVWFHCLCAITLILIIVVGRKSRQTTIKTCGWLVWCGVFGRAAGDCSTACSSCAFVSTSVVFLHLQHQTVLRVKQLFIVKVLSSASLNSKNCTHMNTQLQCKGEWWFIWYGFYYIFFPFGFLFLKNKLNFGWTILSKQKHFCHWCWAHSQSKQLNGYFFRYELETFFSQRVLLSIF